MKKEANAEFNYDLHEEYDLDRLQGGIRGKYAEQYSQGMNLVLPAPDVAKAFPTNEVAN